MSKTFSANDVASHKTPDSLWIIVDEDVYDLTKFQDDHPGKDSKDQAQFSCGASTALPPHSSRLGRNRTSDLDSQVARRSSKE